MRIKRCCSRFQSFSFSSWRFNDLGGKGCKIEFSLAWEFSSRVLGALVGPVFSHIADTMVEAFVKRAERVYGGQ